MARGLFDEIAYQVFVAGNKKRTQRYNDKHQTTRLQREWKQKFESAENKVKHDLECSKLRAKKNGWI